MRQTEATDATAAEMLWPLLLAAADCVGGGRRTEAAGKRYMTEATAESVGRR